MRRIEKITDDRLEKLASLKKMGIFPYPSKTSIKGERIDISKAKTMEGETVLIFGRLMSMRTHGKLIFSDLLDESGQMQVMFQEKELRNKFDILSFIDSGDFLAVKGTVIKTARGEITVNSIDFQILSKAIKPIPSTWFGIKDEEERYRRRYLDLLINNDLKNLFRLKSAFWNNIRQFMISEGFLEVETPALEVSAGGADANPFVTHHEALDMDLYLRISMGELWQKRLMVAGFEKTFEIGRQFRNEGISREHLQDYTQMEFYWGYANFEDSMKLVEKMYKYAAEKTFGRLVFNIEGHKVNLDGKWEKIDYRQKVKEVLDIDIVEASENELRQKIKDLKLTIESKADRGRLIDTLWKKVRKDIVGPVFLVGHPVEVSPLAKRMQENPNFVERYQVILAGSEMGNGYSELNDPVDQKERFEKQQELRDKGDTEAQMHDKDFVEALEYGMPPVSGFGVSERLFSFLVDKPVRECVLFPLLRSKNK